MPRNNIVVSSRADRTLDEMPAATRERVRDDEDQTGLEVFGE